MTYRNKKIRDGAEGRPCVLCLSIIGIVSTDTTVGAHSNALEHGRGYAFPPPDYYISYVCGVCHDLIDGRSGTLTKSEKREMWLEAWIKTVPIWFEEGIVK